MRGQNKNQSVAALLRAAAEACDRGNSVYTADVSMKTPTDDASTVELNVEIRADYDLLNAAKEHIESVGILYE